VVHTSEGPKRRTLYGKTRQEVANKLAKALSSREDGLVFDAGKQTVGEYLERWLGDSLRDTVRHGTFERCEQIVRLHIRPALGNLKLKTLSPAHIQGLYRDRLDSGLSPATVQKIHAVLHKALDQAVRWSLVPRNATEAVKSPRPTPNQIKPLDSEQVKALLKAVHGDCFEALYTLAVTTGLRQGEILGLKWEDIDLANGVIRVRRTLTRRGGRLLLGDPKTKRSRRTVRLTEATVEALKGHLAHQMERMERLGDLYKDQGLVFATGKGTLVNPSNLRKRSFAPLLEKAGLPSVRFHDLRHTCATLLLSRNVNPKIVSEMLGHATVSITLDTYSHVLPNMQDGAARALEDALR
jgi:integrase